MDHDEVKAELLKNDAAFRSLHDEHQQCEARLDEMNDRPYLSPEDETVAKQIKLHKLHLKDRMEQMIRNHPAPTVS